MSGGEAIGIKLGVEIINRVAPKGMAWIKTQLSGKRILIVGQPRAGKTSFRNYLQHGLLTDPSEKTPRTRKIKKSAAFTVSLGRDQSLQIQVKTSIDTVGQVGGMEHADNCRRFKPHVLIVLLDLSTKWAGDNEYAASFYLTELLEYLSEYFSRSNKLRNTVRSIIILLNKKDLSISSKSSSWKKKVIKLIKQNLIHSYGAKANDFSVLACTLAEGIDEGKSADRIINKLALAIR